MTKLTAVASILRTFVLAHAATMAPTLSMFSMLGDKLMQSTTVVFCCSRR